jgi:flagellar FliL protein
MMPRLAQGRRRTGARTNYQGRTMAEKKEEPKAEEKKSKKKLFIIIGAAALVVLIAAGVAGFFLLKKEKPAEGQEAGHETPAAHGEAKEAGAGGEQGTGPKVVVGPMVNVDEFIVNIIGEENSHYVKASMSFEMTTAAAVEEATSRMPQIRDAVLLLIGNKTFDELQDLQGKKQLKAEITSKVNSFLQSGQVKAIYFTDFVVQ